MSQLIKSQIQSGLALCLILTATACGEKTEAENKMAEAPLAQTTFTNSRKCDPQITPGIDCACVEGLIESNWSDYEETDAAAIIASTNEKMSQYSIDILIDVAMQTDEKCATSR